VIALIYLGRLKNNLPERSRGEFDTPYKLFIAAVILASKFIEDSNRISQAVYKFIAPLYDFKIVNEMERSFLGVVKYNLFINLDEVDNFMMDHKNILDL
ncbi:cyclin domain-containing protein, partial [Mycotypha africana]|uniref:cyclin domain-containing protein n=1 Tax=Mycotypha africana TaxID=64632 RepID=UPI002301054C